MKPVILGMLLATLLSAISISGIARGTQLKTDTVTIAGNCNQCKVRIEEAAYIKGVKSALWDKKTKVLTLVFDPAKTDLNKITAAIANAGHDGPGHQASEKDYKNLPECCAYRSGACHHD